MEIASESSVKEDEEFLEGTINFFDFEDFVPKLQVLFNKVKAQNIDELEEANQKRRRPLWNKMVKEFNHTLDALNKKF
jgi:hypothetical protein